jgi:hypothetical protein
MNGSSENKSGFGGSVRSIFLAFVRVIVALLAMLILLLAAYFGVVYLYQQVIEPIQNSNTRMDAIEASQKTQREQVEQRLAQFSERLTAMESKSDLSMQDLDQLIVDLQALQGTVIDQGLDIQRLDQVESAVSYLATQVMSQQMRSEAAMPTPTPFGWKGADEALPLGWLHNDVQVMKALLLIDRARAELLQNNPERAREQITAAKSVLDALVNMESTDPRLAIVPRAAQRLELALDELPASPILTAEDLETAWRLLVDEFIITEAIGVPAVGDVQMSPTVVENPAATFTPTAILRPSVTPAVISSPTPTPITTPTPR